MMSDSPSLPLKLRPSLVGGLALDGFIILFSIFIPMEMLSIVLYVAILMSLISKAFILIFRREKLTKSDLAWIRMGTPACMIITIIFAVVFLKK